MFLKGLMTYTQLRHKTKNGGYGWVTLCQKRLVALQAPKKIFSTKLTIIAIFNWNSRDISVTAWVENDN